jgi:3-dehydroquinate dehydratase II
VKKNILIANGVNFSHLEQRPGYGGKSHNLICEVVASRFADYFDWDFFQSNSEGHFIDRILKQDFDGLIINPAAWTHTSLALADCLEILKQPIIEVHLSNLYQKESLRHSSLTAKHAQTVIMGGMDVVYELAALALLKHWKLE